MHQQTSTLNDPVRDHALYRLAGEGWQLRTPPGPVMTLVRPKRFNPREGVLLAIVCVGLVLLGGVTGILLAVLLAVGDLIWYAARRDETLVVRLNPSTQVYERPGASGRTVPAAAGNVSWDSYSRSVGACSTCGALLGGRARCPRCGKDA